MFLTYSQYQSGLFRSRHHATTHDLLVKKGHHFNNLLYSAHLARLTDTEPPSRPRPGLSAVGIPRLRVGEDVNRDAQLPQGRPFRLASDLAMAPVLYSSLPRTGGIASCQGGGDCFIVGGHFALAEAHASILLSALTPIVYLRDESDKAALRWSLERMRQELLERQPGAALVARHLAQMILVQALRLHFADGAQAGTGWLFALADRQVRQAIGAVHSNPGHRWTLQTLAKRAGMSRSGFARRFRELVGQPPMEYVTRWRMTVAADRLVTSNDPVSVVARVLGYDSESAFSTAFKRVMGRSPRDHSRGARQLSRSNGA